MSQVIIRGANGELKETRVVSKEAHVIPESDDLNEFHPTVVQSVEYDHKGGTSSITTVCGESESRRTSDNLPDITIEGVIVKDEIEDMKNLKRGEEITLISDVHKGQIYVRRVTIGQDTDVVEYVPDGNEERQLAFSFQLQLGQLDGQSGEG